MIRFSSGSCVGVSRERSVGRDAPPKHSFSRDFPCLDYSILFIFCQYLLYSLRLFIPHCTLAIFGLLCAILYVCRVLIQVKCRTKPFLRECSALALSSSLSSGFPSPCS